MSLFFCLQIKHEKEEGRQEPIDLNFTTMFENGMFWSEKYSHFFPPRIVVLQSVEQSMISSPQNLQFLPSKLSSTS